MVTNKSVTRERAKIKIRKRLSGTSVKPRLSVFKSLKHIYAQIIDDGANQVLVSASTKSKELAESLSGMKGKKEAAKAVGKLLAEKAKAKSIETIVFDRNGYQYHGRVQSLADGAREGGLKF